MRAGVFVGSNSDGWTKADRILERPGESDWRSLKAGVQYRVQQEFHDFDGVVHSVGEEWTFLGSSFLPHDDGLCLFVSLDRRQEWCIRLQWRPVAQKSVIDNFHEFVSESEDR